MLGQRVLVGDAVVGSDEHLKGKVGNAVSQGRSARSDSGVEWRVGFVTE